MDGGARRRVLLVACERALRGVQAQLDLIEPQPLVVGAFVEGRCPPGMTNLGALTELDEARATRLARRVDCAVVSLPATHGAVHRRIRRVLREARVPVVELPAIEDLLDRARLEGDACIERTRTIDLARLVDRPSTPIQREMVGEILRGRRVLITGAGGSIGSELARQVAGFGPELLVLMERGENALFEIDRTLERRYPEISRRALLHDVTDETGTRRRVRESAPHVVIHAAAHKHVPLMEEHPQDAVRNNVFGTRSIAEASAEAHVERFVLISSDKAVRPSSIMGATKRLAELYVQALQERCATTRFSMVRFGNVLGSAGSVIPIWSAQIAEGGPLTVTDPRMTRYFMTIPEAAGLVLQASALPAEGPAPVYVLDMGEPVRILELAKRFVRAHGYEAFVVPTGVSTPSEVAEPALDGAMPIVITGIRPGEKLHEVLAYEDEELRPTAHPGIRAQVDRGSGPRIDADAMIADLRGACASGDRAIILSAIRRHVHMSPPRAVLQAG